jgi:tetratricopeptide (TPR) repeat protein
MQICLKPPSTREPSLSWYDLPAEVKRLLIAAANSWEDTAQSQDYIHQALLISDRSLDVLVAAYRYFFYKHNDAAALQIAIQVIEQIKQLERFPKDWHVLAPILSSRKEEPNIRLYLNAYAASGLVLARMGAIDEAKTIASRVSEIDSKREFGAATVLDILTNSDGEEED